MYVTMRQIKLLVRIEVLLIGLHRVKVEATLPLDIIQV